MTQSDKTLLESARKCATGGGPCVGRCPYAGTTLCQDRLVTALANRLAEVLAEEAQQE